MRLKVKKSCKFLLWGLILMAAVSVCVSNCSCASVKNENCPYEIEGNISEGEQLVFRFKVLNKSVEPVRNFLVVFSLYDGDGEPAFIDSDCVEIRLSEVIESGEIREFEIKVDDYVEGVSDGGLFVDYLFLREIVYESGNKWSDVIGRFAV